MAFSRPVETSPLVRDGAPLGLGTAGAGLTRGTALYAGWLGRRGQDSIKEVAVAVSQAAVASPI